MSKPCLIDSLDNFDATLREIAIIDSRVAEHNVARRDAILTAEGAFTARTHLLVGRRIILGEQLELYYRANRAELEKGKKKSIDLQYGRAGIKGAAASLRTRKGWTWTLALAAIKEAGHEAYIRAKESVNKDALKSAKLTPEQLAEFGLRLHAPETFFFETFPGALKPGDKE